MNAAVEAQLSSTSGRAGRKPSTAPMEQNVYIPSNIDKLLVDGMSLLPDPDEVWRKGLISYSDLFALTRDAHATSCVTQRKSQTKSHAIRVEPRPGTSGEYSEKALKACAKMVHDWSQGRYNMIGEFLDAKLVGMQPFELNWHFDSEVGGNIVSLPRGCMQEWFGYTADGQLRQRNTYGAWSYHASSIDSKPVPPFKILMARNEPTMRNPYGSKLLTPCYWPCQFKRGGIRFFAEYAERFGMPTMHIKAPQNTNQGLLSRFVGELTKMMRKGIIITRGEYDVSHLDMDSKYQTTHLYNTFCDQMDKEMSKALLGQTLTTDEGGSRAQGDIHKQILETLWKTDDSFLATEITNLFDLVTYVNWGPGVVGPQAVVGEQLGTERMERDQILRDFHGIEFTPEYLERHYDIAEGRDYKRVDPLKASYKDLPDGAVPKSKGGSRPSEAAKSTKEKRDNHRNR